MMICIYFAKELKHGKWVKQKESIFIVNITFYVRSCGQVIPEQGSKALSWETFTHLLNITTEYSPVQVSRSTHGNKTNHVRGYS